MKSLSLSSTSFERIWIRQINKDLPEGFGGREKCELISYLELSQGETPAGAHLAVILDGRTSYNGAQLVDWPRSQSGGLGLTGNPSGGLLSGLLDQTIC